MVRWMAGLDGHESTTASGTYFFVGDQLAFDYGTVSCRFN